MRIKIRYILFFFLLCLFSSPKLCYAQKINIELQTVDSLILNNEEDKVLDLNGEICSLIIMQTNSTDFKFYSNLGVEKIKKTDTGYKIWIPNQATLLKFTIPGFQLFEYTLPHSDYKYSVYIISLEIERSEIVILKDTIVPSLSFSTIPLKTRIYINGVYKGKSPIILRHPEFERFEYSIKKKGYDSYSAKDSMDKRTKNIVIELNNQFRDKRFFLTFSTILDYQRLNTPDNPGGFRDGDADGVPGLTMGSFGKTGMYGTIRFIDKNTSNYMHTRKFCVVSGITQQLGKSVFVYGGPGYMKRLYENNIDNISKEAKSLYLNAGFIFRIGWYSLLQLDFGKSINNKYESIGLGLGFNFPKKQKTQLSLK